ncbi:MAG: sialidase family protein [Armatimonadota bacterium]
MATKLNGLSVTLSVPRVVAETSVGRCWYPDILKFATGEIMLNHSVNADANDNQANAQAVYLSFDGGETFDFAYDVNGFHNGGGEPRVSLPDGRIVGASTFLKPDGPGEARRFFAHRWTYDQGGRRYSVEPWGALVEGLPRPVPPYPISSRTWWSRINWFSDIVPLADGTWVSTISLHFTGDELSSTVAVASPDEGRHWEYLSTIAGPADVPGANEGFDEPCLLLLDSGELLCISRVGSGTDQLLARTYSADGGRTWSPLDRLPAYSVAPQLCKLRNGALLLATGRPGLFLWCSAEPRGETWQPIDLLAHHNAAIPQWPMTAEQTTAYTAMVEVSPDRAFLVYDRTPFGWGAVPAESGERSQIWLVEVTVE